jgi:hypothetical protein
VDDAHRAQLLAAVLDLGLVASRQQPEVLDGGPTQQSSKSSGIGPSAVQIVLPQCRSPWMRCVRARASWGSMASAILSTRSR